MYWGYLNGMWYSATTDFPISAETANISLKNNFIYTETDTVPSNKAACIGLVFKNDYDPSTQDYSSQ